jgi:renalase
MKIAVVGAGAAGLSCARQLQQRGCHVEVFEKSRGPGGRMPARWVGDKETEGSFDHGTQYFTAEHPAFLTCIEDAHKAGAIAPWCVEVVDLAYAQITPRPSPAVRWVGTPSMSAWGRFLAQGLHVHYSTRVADIVLENGAWTLKTEKTSGEPNSIGPWDWVVLAVPAEQAVPFLRLSVHLQEQAAFVQCLPNWTVMLGFDVPLSVPFDAAFVHHSPIGWLARNNSKPGRQPQERWVVQATSDWSMAHLELDSLWVASQLAEVFLTSLGLRSQPVELVAHRWRYSTPNPVLDRDYLLDSAICLAVCGDWVKSARVEGAWLSGWSLGRALPV